MLVAWPVPMYRSRATWLRVLRLYDISDDTLTPAAVLDEQSSLFDAGVRARSRFRSVVDPERFALYSVPTDSLPPPPFRSDRQGEHTPVALRECRRAPPPGAP